MQSFRRARLIVGAVLSAVPAVFSQVVINEFHYDPDVKTEPVEFIELYNSGPDSVELSGWFFSDGIEYTFPPGSIIASDGYVVVAQDVAAFSNTFGVEAVGPWDGKLSNEGETLELCDASTAVVDTVTYGAGCPWPTAARGGGSSVELINPGLPRMLPGSWRASVLVTNVSLFSATDYWRYRKGTSEPSAPPSAWRTADFTEDGMWFTGRASIGYGKPFVTTALGDMLYNYSSVYLRKSFVMASTTDCAYLRLECQYDDGIVVWINGTNVVTANVASNEMPYTGTAIVAGDYLAYRPFILAHPEAYLVPGSNTVAVQLLNASLSNSSDAFFDARLSSMSAAGTLPSPTPGRRNSMFATNAPPLVSGIAHSPQQPTSGVPVHITAMVTDDDGVSNVTVWYQVVNPGSYSALYSPAYTSGWISVVMHDDGLNGDATADDGVFTAELAPAVQAHRRLVRYRIAAVDSNGFSVTLPYPDDPVPNFACFCYDGIPQWRGALRPGVTPVLTFPTNVMQSVQAIHLIATEADVLNCQYNGAYAEDYFTGTMVYEGIVYDHMEFRVKGEASTYVNGKNKWKFNFTPTHRIRLRDNFRRLFPAVSDKFSINPGVCAWWNHDAGTDGIILNDALVYRFCEVAGTPASKTFHAQLRVIDKATEADAANQYEGDFWGIYTAIEDVDGQFLDARSLPDGNMYKVAGSVADSIQKNQGATQVTNASDLAWFTSGTTGYPVWPVKPLAWWLSNVTVDAYLAYHAAWWAVNNADQREMWNSVYYHNPDDNRWTMLPWDVELSFCSTSHWYEEGGQLEKWSYMLKVPQIALAFTNRVRELGDLLFNNDQNSMVVDEDAWFVSHEGSVGHTLAEANQAMWDYHPRMTMPGYFYANYLPPLSPRVFTNYLQYMRAFTSPGGYGGRALARRMIDPAIPSTPTITYMGAAGYPADDLRFRSSAFNDPQGTGTFAAMQWRLGEITVTNSPSFNPAEPRVYEIQAVWSSGELSNYASDIAFPACTVLPGHTYRARIRMKDTTGRWSHWSAPVQFAPSAPLVAQRLRVTEMMYHPPLNEPSEFIELYNTGIEPLSLTNVAFTDGIDFAFSNDSSVLELGPTGCIVIVQDSGGFASRYDTNGIVVAGQYTNRLSNSGERISIDRDDGIPIQSFTYSDLW